MVIFWHRRDLRTRDNRGLIAAARSSNAPTLGIFVIDPKFFTSEERGNNRIQFLFESLTELEQEYRDLGSRLLILEGNPLEVIPKLIDQNNSIKALFFNEDFTGYARMRDKAIFDELSEREGFSVNVSRDQVVYRKLEVAKDDGTAYTVYSPYKRKWLKLLEEQGGADTLKPEEADRENLTENLISESYSYDLDLSEIQEFDLKKAYAELEKNPKLDQRGGYAAAKKRWLWFTGQGNRDNPPIYTYKEDRNRVDLDGTSKLSAHLKFGTISIRELFCDCFELLEQVKGDKTATKAVDHFISELIWREFYQQILANFPKVEQSEFQEKYADVPWDTNAEFLEQWQQGQTGYPFIDASMRQLNETGWMHNRGRMAVAMFLTKDLHLNWRAGEEYFMKHLVDGDIASNNGGWQWSASTGTDAAPYFRIFNPISQALKVDPEGEFVRKFVPELASIPGKKIHTPWELKPAELEEYGIELGKDYPEPMVDHHKEREKALKAFKQI